MKHPVCLTRISAALALTDDALPDDTLPDDTLPFIICPQFHDERIPHYPDSCPYQRAALRSGRVPTGLVLATSAVAAVSGASL